MYIHSFNIFCYIPKKNVKNVIFLNDNVIPFILNKQIRIRFTGKLAFCSNMIYD